MRRLLQFAFILLVALHAARVAGAADATAVFATAADQPTPLHCVGDACSMHGSTCCSAHPGCHPGYFCAPAAAAGSGAAHFAAISSRPSAGHEQRRSGHVPALESPPPLAG
ncbi:MAG: hypothetical protein ACT4P4_04090 [Betaproteobacteria bacterium]